MGWSESKEPLAMRNAAEQRDKTLMAEEMDENKEKKCWVKRAILGRSGEYQPAGQVMHLLI